MLMPSNGTHITSLTFIAHTLRAFFSPPPASQFLRINLPSYHRLPLNNIFSTSAFVYFSLSSFSYLFHSLFDPHYAECVRFTTYVIVCCLLLFWRECVCVCAPIALHRCIYNAVSQIFWIHLCCDCDRVKCTIPKYCAFPKYSKSKERIIADRKIEIVKKCYFVRNCAFNERWIVEPPKRTDIHSCNEHCVHTIGRENREIFSNQITKFPPEAQIQPRKTTNQTEESRSECRRLCEKWLFH